MEKKIFTFERNDQTLTPANMVELCYSEFIDNFSAIEKMRQEILNADSTINTPSVNSLENDIAQLKTDLAPEHEDVQKHFTCMGFDAFEHVEDILTADIKQLKGEHLSTRYIILKNYNDVKFDEEYAKSLIGEEVLGYKQDDLKDVKKLTKLIEKRELCREIHHNIDGEHAVDLSFNATNALEAEFDKLSDDEKKHRLNTDPNMLKALVHGYLGAKTLMLETVERQALNAALEDMPYDKKAVENAIYVQKAINEKPSPDGSSFVRSSSPSGQSFALSLAEYLISPVAEYLQIYDYDNRKAFHPRELVREVDGQNEFFDALLGYENSVFDKMGAEAYEAIKSAVRDDIEQNVEGSKPFNKTTFEKRVELLKKIMLKRPYSEPVPKLPSYVEATEENVENSISDHFITIYGDFVQHTNSTFDLNMLKRNIEICRVLKFEKQSILHASDYGIAFTPVYFYLKGQSQSSFMNFKTADVNAHKPISTFFTFMNDHSEFLLKASGDFIKISLSAKESYCERSIRSLIVHKLLVPLFTSLPTQDFSHLSKVRNDEIEVWNMIFARLRDYDESKDSKVEYLTALIGDGAQLNKKNILFLYGALDDSASCEDKRARLDAIGKASATDAPIDIIIEARDWLLEDQNEFNLDLRVLYKTYYDALRTMYTLKDGEDLDDVLPNQWTSIIS